ncbi:hypothetical protein CMV_014785 [Castanea mollissima]|uniref:Uncharacterized protein n=1 Tax=Castanea mollissima TaxID=60419 RepID=A0A8J4QWK7_9ROSI|nr:hypothetical protein CMV_014785 [Castanea mollissima]
MSQSVNGSAWSSEHRRSVRSSGHRHMWWSHGGLWCGFDGGADGFVVGLLWDRFIAVVVGMVWVFGHLGWIWVCGSDLVAFGWLSVAEFWSKRRSSKPSALSATPLTKALVTSKEDVPEEFATLVLNFISRNRIGPHGVDVAAKAKDKEGVWIAKTDGVGDTLHKGKVVKGGGAGAGSILRGLALAWS